VQYKEARARTVLVWVCVFSVWCRSNIIGKLRVEWKRSFVVLYFGVLRFFGPAPARNTINRVP
jgi:hypothetical protein